ncbi:MAG: methyltransferase domain-containing protein [Ruminococcaceae bacterium]|nr:methyltransferase domain-containing protein [Oscillospiraceae bacterium]
MEEFRTSIFEVLACPLCASELEQKGNTFVCLGEKPHCFDVASSGYVNLLPPGKGKNAHTGDDKGMISARVEFLSKGYYTEISKAVGTMVADIAKAEGLSRVFLADSGCGEGFHTCNTVKTSAENGVSITAVGFDASKHGAAAASKRSRREKLAYDRKTEGAENSEAFFAAGNIFSLPLADESMDFVVSMFAPVAGEENMRVLKKGGYLIIAASGADHLYELRAALYDEPRRASGEIKIPEGFEKADEKLLTYKITVGTNAEILNLFEMTPFYYRTSEKDKEKLSSLSSLEVTVQVKFCICRKI